MEVEKKKKIAIVGASIVGSMTAITLLLWYFNKRAEPELTKEEIRELEYDEYVSPKEEFLDYNKNEREEGRFRISGNKYGRVSDMFKVQVREDMMRGARERIRLRRNQFNVIQAHKGSSLSDVIADPFAVPRKIGSSNGRFRRSGERW